MHILRRFVAAVVVTAASLVLCLGAIRPAAAWWAPGHAIIALMAYREMQPMTRTALDDILRQHPDYKNWLLELPANVTEAQRGEYIFAIAATWSDRIKDARDESVSTKFFNPADKRNPPPQPYPSASALYPDLQVHDTWHYMDVPISLDGKPRTLPAQESILTALPTSRGNVTVSSLPASYRAYYLCWLAHLVGDIHQPLHATERFTVGRSQGDAGGNGVRFQSDGSPTQPRNLHAFWDGLLGSGPDPNRYNTLQNGWSDLNATIDKIRTAAPRLLAGYDSAARDSLDETVWLRESFSVAQQFVYTFAASETSPGADGTVPQPDAEYRAMALRIAYQRAALAAHRLAHVCDLLFARPEQP